MTEDEARKTMCPEMSKPVPDIAGASILHVVHCFTSDCACWVWDNVLLNPESQENGLIRPHYEQSKTQGHSGLIK